MKKRSALTSALIVVGFGVILSFALFRLNDILGVVRWLGSAVSSLAWGAIAALILNVPMRAIERLLTRIDRRNHLKRSKRVLSLILTLFALCGVVYLVLTMVLPELYHTLLTILEMAPGIVQRIDNFLKGYGIDIVDMLLPSMKTPESVAEIQSKLKQAIDFLISGVSFSTALLAQIADGVMDTFFSILFAIYILASKEKLSSNARKLLYAYVPTPCADKALGICRLAHGTYSSFISCQCTEAVILGSMFFVSMTLFRMPYALLVSVFITVTALIPLVGAWLGCIVGALLILIDNPVTAFWFVLMFLLLQQIEGNLIIPMSWAIP